MSETSEAGAGTLPDPGATLLADPDIYGNERFAGLPVRSVDEAGWDTGGDTDGDTGGEPSGRVAWMVTDGTEPGSSRGESDLPRELDELLENVAPGDVRALAVTGYGAVDAPLILAEYAARLPALTAVFLGFIGIEQWEMSWIGHGDITPVLEAYPRLERLEVRGSDGLTLRPVTHEHLRVLRFETGGLPGAVVRAVGASDFPALEHLELWLGSEGYYGDHTMEDLDDVFSGARLPALRRLGLRNSEQQDAVAAALATAPVVAGLDELSLGQGALTDRGMEALLGGQPLTHLRVLDLRHHFLSRAMADRVRRALPGVAIDLTGPRFDLSDGRPYITVAE
ncbi:STM4015 family protein [Nonomuraea candida]|uniref:STM4015 family protein n=1 Tax=Nonomuraea candida TaxID=359159 RepID=UPI0006940379|nr:STM4015 family protein [Nonomuraea candida]